MPGIEKLQTIIVEKSPANMLDIDWSEVIAIPQLVENIQNTRLSADRYVLEPRDGKYGIEDLAELIRWEKFKPSAHSYKVAIITYGELLNIESQNRLLKTLEEPSPYTQLIVIVNNHHRLVDTILSRCQIVIMTNQKSQSANPLANDFLSAATVSERFKLAEEINASDQRSEIVSQILNEIVTGYSQGQNRVDAQKLLDITVNFRKNKTGIRLLLETLAIMLN